MDINNGALKGVRVVDFSWVWAGPYATLLLSFLGAEVIKVESLARLDQSREGSNTTGDDFEDYDASPHFNNLNLNKKSVTLNLKTPEGVELAKQLVAKSDVVVENMRAGVMDKLGLGYQDLVKVNPNIIMLSSSGFGSKGPYGKFAGYAPIFAAFGGLAFLTGYEDGEPNTMSGVMDLRVGTAGAFAVVTALINRQKTGKGQYIDLSSSECVSTLVGSELLEYSMNGTSPSRTGNGDSIMAPHNCYRSKGDDRWISIAVKTNEEWEALCGAMGNPDWCRDAAYADVYGRWTHRAELDKQLSAWTIGYTDCKLMDLLQSVGVAAMPSFSAEQLFADPHIKARGKVIDSPHPKMGVKHVISPPWILSGTPATIRRHSPLLGEHNQEILGGLLGMSDESIAALHEKRIVY